MVPVYTALPLLAAATDDTVKVVLEEVGVKLSVTPPIVPATPSGPLWFAGANPMRLTYFPMVLKTIGVTKLYGPPPGFGAMQIVPPVLPATVPFDVAEALA